MTDTPLSADGYAPIPVDVLWFHLSSTALGEKGKYHLRDGTGNTPLCDGRDRLNFERTYKNPMLQNRCKRCIRGYHTRKVPAMPNNTRLDRLQRQIDNLQQEMARIASLPQEPNGDNPVIIFDMTFHGGTRVYSYAARKAGGSWNTTGPRSPKAYPWDQLIEWIDDQHTDGIEGANIQVVSKTKPL